jgi:hypothetical protein
LCSLPRHPRAAQLNAPPANPRRRIKNGRKTTPATKYDCDKTVVTRFRARRNRILTEFRTRNGGSGAPDTATTGEEGRARQNRSTSSASASGRKEFVQYVKPRLSASARRPGMNGSWFVSALAGSMGAFRRDPAALVWRNETNNVLACVDHQFLKD